MRQAKIFYDLGAIAVAIPLPDIGYSRNAAILEALAAFLEAQTGFSWRGAIYPPSQVDTLVGTIIPYTESAPMGDTAATRKTIQFLVQAKAVDQTISSTMQGLESWIEKIALVLNTLRVDGVTGTYLGHSLTQALVGIKPAELSDSRWAQMSTYKLDARAGESANLVAVKLVLNYEVPLDHPELRKAWY